MRTNKIPMVYYNIVTVPIDWEYKEASVDIPDNGDAEKQIAAEMDGMYYID